MDYEILSLVGFGLAIFCAVKTYDAIDARAKYYPKTLGWLAALPIFAVVFALSDEFAHSVLLRECSSSHDPSACVADTLDSPPDDVP